MITFKSPIRLGIMLSVIGMIAVFGAELGEWTKLPQELEAFHEAQFNRLGGSFLFLLAILFGLFLLALVLLWRMKIEGVYIVVCASAVAFLHDYFNDVMIVNHPLAELLAAVASASVVASCVLVWAERRLRAAEAAAPPAPAAPEERDLPSRAS